MSALILRRSFFSKELSSGIRFFAQRGGLFIFDFTKWPPGESFTMPHFETDERGMVPKEFRVAEKEAERRVYNGVAAMNAHQACLLSAMTSKQGHALLLRQVITPSNTFGVGIGSDGKITLGLNPSIEPIHAYVSVNADARGHRDNTVVKLETLDVSVAMLDQILVHDESELLLRLTHLIFLGANAYREHDFPTCTVLAWTVCERLIRTLWDRYLASVKARDSASMNKERYKKLTGRDFSASVITETLSLAGLISREMFDRVNSTRSIRNGWLHNLRPIDNSDASAALGCAQDFFNDVFKLPLSVKPSLSMTL